MNKPVYLGFSILELSKILMHEFWYDYVKPKYSVKLKLGYMNTDSFIIYTKAGDIYQDIAENTETRFDTSNYELDRLLPKWKNKKVIELMKDELGCKIITEFVELRAKTYIYLIDDGSEDKKSKRYKKVFHKKTLKFEKYKNCLEATQLENKISYFEENKININNLQKNYEQFIRNNKSILKTPQSERHNVFTEELTRLL